VTTERAGYRELLSNREATAIIAARTLSGLGDQIARAVLALYVLSRGNGDPLTAALVLAVAYVPGTLGFAVLGSLADRYPRRAVMLTGDLIRALLVGVLALAVSFGSALWVLLTLLLVVELVGPPASSARRALLADVSRSPDEFARANGLTNSLDQAVQVLGFILGAAALQSLTPTWAMFFDAVTFVVSFVLVAAAVTPRPAPDDTGGTSAARLWADMVDGVQTIRSTLAVGAFTRLAWCSAGLLVATDAVALPFVTQQGGSDVTASVLLAATPAGAALSAWYVARLPLPRQLVVMFPLAFASTIPLMVSLIEPSIPVAFALWFATGLMQGYIVTAMTEVVNLTPVERRGRVVGVASAGFNAAAMLTIVALGALAQSVTPATAVAAAGAVGVLLLCGLYLRWPARAVSQAMRTAYRSASKD
jgi:hypothetical protein